MDCKEVKIPTMLKHKTTLLRQTGESLQLSSPPSCQSSHVRRKRDNPKSALNMNDENVIDDKDDIM